MLFEYELFEQMKGRKHSVGATLTLSTSSYVIIILNLLQFQGSINSRAIMV